MSPTNNDKPSMTADPLLLTPATGAKRSEAEADDLQGFPVSMLCCGDGSCGNLDCEGNPDNVFARFPVDRKLRRRVIIATLVWCFVVVLAFIVFVGYVFGKAFPGL